MRSGALYIATIFLTYEGGNAVSVQTPNGKLYSVLGNPNRQAVLDSMFMSESDSTMCFEHALGMARRGFALRRSSWPTDHHLAINNTRKLMTFADAFDSISYDSTMFLVTGEIDHRTAADYTLTADDLLAQDWMATTGRSIG